jgi:hypothetical protein
MFVDSIFLAPRHLLATFPAVKMMSEWVISSPFAKDADLYGKECSFTVSFGTLVMVRTSVAAKYSIITCPYAIVQTIFSSLSSRSPFHIYPFSCFLVPLAVAYLTSAVLGASHRATNPIRAA